MIRNFFSQLWTNIKRSPLIAVLVFVQIVLTSYCLFNIMWTFSEYDANNARVQSIYGKKSIYVVKRKPHLSQEDYMRVTGAFFGMEGEDSSDFEAFRTKANELVAENEGIETALFLPTPIYFENNSIANGYAVDNNYIEAYKPILESGRFFTEEEYSDFDYDHIPVVLGAAYKNTYSLGDTFKASVFMSSEKMTYEVVGFLAEGQVIIEAGNSRMITYDNCMMVPYIYKTEEEWFAWIYDPANEKYRPPVKGMLGAYFLPGLGHMSFAKTFLVDKGNEALAETVISTALAESGLDDLLTYGISSRVENQAADYFRENAATLVVLVSVMALFAILGIVFSAINNATANMRSYAIQTLLGTPPLTNVVNAAIETFLYCALGFLPGFFIMYSVLLKNGYAGHPALGMMIERGFAVAIIFTAAACLLTFLFVRLKMRNYSVAELIRGREVKKDSGLPLYRTITFTMFLLASVSVTFLASYIWTVDHIDKYQNNYLSSGQKFVFLQPLAVDEPPEFALQYNFDNLDDYSMDMLIRQKYDTESEVGNGPKIRAFFSKNGYNIPELTQGRFFTEEEMSKQVNYVVAGKNAVKDFAKEKNGKLYFPYSGFDYEIIGIVGREGHETSMDDWVIFSMETLVQRYGSSNAPVFISASSYETEKEIMNSIIELSENNYRYEQGQFYPPVDIGVEKSVMYYFIALILISFVVFCIYYIDRILHIMNVKKVIGYSKLMIFTDTAAQFIALSVSAYVLGNGIMLLLAKTVLSNIALFSSFNINLPVLAFSFGILLAIAFLFSVLAVYRSFAGTARDLKRG
ncbi:MAG: ABC transporter permease [Clostridia bacterium]|nr:ABC transporter permease [Clostridia bacterium]